MITVSISGGTVTATAVLQDSSDPPMPVNPDPGSKIRWRVYGQNQETIRFQREQDVEDQIAVGTYQIKFAPQVVEVCYIEVLMIRNGDKHAGRVSHRVKWVSNAER